MNLENEIRKLLKEKPLSISQVTNHFKNNYNLDSVTAKMPDLYEDDDGLLKIIGVDYKNIPQKRNSCTPKIIKTIESLAGKLPYTQITNIVNEKFKTTFIPQAVYYYVYKKGLSRKNRVCWSSEKDNFLKKHASLNNKELTQALNKRFNTTIPEKSVYNRFYSLGLRRRK